MQPFDRHLTLERIAGCPFAPAHDYLREFLWKAKRSAGAIVVRSKMSGRTFERPVEFDFALRLDTAEQGRPHDEIALRWYGGSPLLPDFTGVLRLRIFGLSTRVIIDGSYTAPLGALGAAFDALVGHHIAWHTLDDLVQRLVAELETRDALWRAEMKAVENVDSTRVEAVVS
jgi:hypothetical protein